MISEEQLRVSEKYFNMRPDDLQDLRNQSLLTQVKQQIDEEPADQYQQQSIQGGHRFTDQNNIEYEEIDMDDNQVVEP